jgi:hypothetical protein
LRPLSAWIARTIIFLPVPLSPWIRTLAIRPEGLFGARHNDQQVPGFADDAAEQKIRLVWAQWQLDGHCDRNRLHKWKNLEMDHFQSTYTLRLNERSAAK